MESWIFCTVLLAASFPVLRAQASITIPPEDVTVRLGESVNFTCGIQYPQNQKDTTRWRRIVKASEPSGEVFFTYHLDKEPTNKDKFQAFGKLPGAITVQINNVEFADAGIYVCELLRATAEKKTANLVVLDTPVPIVPATTVKHGSVATLTCEATFAGPRKEEFSAGHMPVMSSYLEQTKLSTTDEVFEGLPGTKWWIMRQTAEVSVTDEDDGKELICSIETKNPYYHLDNRETLQVQHPVSLVSVMNVQDVYYVGDIINCTANGNPSPDFKWEPVNVPQMTGARTYDSNQLELTGNLIGKNTWKCTVSNDVGGKIIKEYEISFEVEPDPYAANAGESKSGGTNSVAIALGVVIPMIVIGVILLVGFLVYRRKANKDTGDSKKTPPVPKELPPNPRPPGEMRVMPPQVYDPKEAERATPLLEEEIRPARPVRPMPQPRTHTPETHSLNSSQDATEV